MNESQICTIESNGFVKFVPENTDFFRNPVIALIVFHLSVGFFTVVGNGLTIAAIIKSPNLQKPSYLLIASMAFTDLLVAFLFIPFSIIWITSLIWGSDGIICRVIKPATIMAALPPGLCLSMSLLISIDRYLALSLKHRYRAVVTKSRVLIPVAMISLVVSTAVISTIVIDSLYVHHRVIGAVTGSVMLISTFLFYVKSFTTLRRYKCQVHAFQRNQSHGAFDVEIYKKSLKTMVIILLWLLACYLPLLFTQYIAYRFGATKISFLGVQIGKALFVFNSCTNPIIYIIRFSDLRQTIRQYMRL